MGERRNRGRREKKGLGGMGGGGRTEKDGRKIDEERKDEWKERG